MASTKSAKFQTEETYSNFEAAVKGAEYLSAERERELALLSHDGDLAARNKLVHSHMRLVRKIAAGFAHYGHSMKEIVSAGNVGLLEGAERFDPAMDNRFSTYVTWWIRAEIMDYVLKNASSVKMPSTKDIKSLFYKGKKALAEFEALGLSKSEVMQRMSERFHLPAEEIENLMIAQKPGTSLSTPVSEREDNSGEFGDFLEDVSLSQEEVLVQADEHDHNVRRLNDAIALLNEREGVVFRARRLTDDPPTLEALAERYSVSKERIRQIEVRAFEKVKTALMAQAA